MKILFLYFLPLILLTSANAETTNSRKELSEKLTSSCQDNKELKNIFAQHSNDKRNLIIKSYCDCRTRFLFQNLNYKEVQNVYHRNEPLTEDLFQKLIIDCTSYITNLIK